MDGPLTTKNKWAIGITVSVFLLLVVIIILVAVLVSRSKTRPNAKSDLESARCQTTSATKPTVMAAVKPKDASESCQYVFPAVPANTSPAAYADIATTALGGLTSSYTGVLLPVVSPNGSNFTSDVLAFAKLVARIPLQYRVGVSASIHSDGAWTISFATAPTYALTKCGRTGSCGGVVPVPSNGKLVCDPINPVPPTGLQSDPHACQYVQYYKGPGNTNPMMKPTDCAVAGTCTKSTGTQATQIASNKLACDPINPVPPTGLQNDPHACQYVQYYKGPGNTNPMMKPTECAVAGTCTVAAPISNACPAKPTPPYASGPNDSSACWYVVSGTPGSIRSTPPIGFPSTNLQFGGGCGAGNAVSCTGNVSSSTGSPYQTLSSSAACSTGACPGNASRLGYYVALVNATLRSIGSQQRISMLSWDAVSQCELFQFLYALRQFGVSEDILPPVQGVNQPWLIYGLLPFTVVGCEEWAATPIDLVTNAASANRFGNVHEYGDMVTLACGVCPTPVVPVLPPSRPPSLPPSLPPSRPPSRPPSLPPSRPLPSALPPVRIHLPSFTAIKGVELQRMTTNVLNFIEAFNAKYYSDNVQIVSFSPTRVFVSDPSLAPDKRLLMSNADFTAISAQVKSRGMNLTLGISQADSVSLQMPSIGVLNAQLKASNLPQYTTFITDGQDNWWKTVPVADGMRTLTSQAVANGVNTVAIAGGPNYTSGNQLQNGLGLKPVPGVTQVGMPEIYDIGWAGCDFPPPMCKWSVGSSIITDCTVPVVTNDYIDNGIAKLFTPSKECHIAGVKPFDFLTPVTPEWQTWPSFAIEVSKDCFQNAAEITITQQFQFGCNSMWTFTVEQFVYFCKQFGVATTNGRKTANVQGSSAEVPIMLYEAAFIPIKWMTEVGATYVAPSS